MSGGCSADPVTLLRGAGVDIASPAPVSDALKLFDQLIGEMEEDGISLERSFDLYNKGMGLLKECSKSIDEVEKKVLILDEDGETHEF